MSFRDSLEGFSFRHRLITRKVLIRSGSFRVYSWHPKTWRLEDAAPLSWMIDRVGADDVVYDIGANRGYYALSVVANAPRARVIAVEPNPRIFRMLSANVGLNREAGRVEAVSCGLGEETGQMTLFIARADSASSFDSRHALGAGRGIERAVRVPVSTLDDLVFSRGYPAPGHIKVDTEGFEGPILRGARGVLERFSPTLYLEIHGKPTREGDNEREIRSVLGPAGYRMLKEGRFLLCTRDRRGTP